MTGKRNWTPQNVKKKSIFLWILVLTDLWGKIIIKRKLEIEKYFGFIFRKLL